MRKKLLTVITAVTIAYFSLFVNELSTFANHPNNTKMTALQTSPVEVVQKNVNEETDIYKITVSIPVFSGLKDNEYEQSLNDTVARAAQQEINIFKQQAQDNAKYLKEIGVDNLPYEFIQGFEVKQTGKVVSLIIHTYSFTGGAHGNETADYYNFINKKNASMLQLKDLFKDGSDYVTKINEMIEKQIAERTEQGEMFFEGEMGFHSISENQHFYIDNDKLVIAFDKYEIAPGVMGLPTFELPLEDLKPMLKRSVVKALQLS